MKILKIELQNINSLKSAQPILIDFESSHFQDVGLYAITGSTGAGKTTILDAITIGLYHKVARFSQPSSKANLQDVVSYGADEAFVNITFLANGERYEAHWSMRLVSKHGKVLTNPSETVRLKNISTGKIIAEKKREVQSAIEEVTLLTYDQFLRSVLLAQGEFAAFLSASPAQKGELLEQITGEEIYKKIGEVVNNKIYDESRLLKDIKAKINDVDLLPEELRSTLNLEQTEIQEKLKTHQVKVDRYKGILDWFKQEKTLAADQIQINQKEVALKEAALKFEGNIKALATHEKALPFQNLLIEDARLQEDLTNRQAKLNVLKDELVKLTASLKEKEAIQLATKTNLDKAEQAIEKWDPMLTKVGELDLLFVNLEKDKLKEQEALKTVVDGIKASETKRIAFVSKKDILKEEIARLSKAIQSNQNLPKVESELSNLNRDLTARDNRAERMALLLKQEKERAAQLNALTEQIEKLKKAIQPKVDEIAKQETALVVLNKRIESLGLKQLLVLNDTLNAQGQTIEKGKELAAKRKEKAVKVETIKDSIQVLKDQVQLGTEEKEAAEPHYKAAETAVADTERIVQLERQVKNLTEERKKLIEGEPCALCGSKDHPLVEHYNAVAVDQSIKDLATRKKTLESWRKTVDEIKIKLNSVNTQLTEKTKVFKEEQALLIDLENQYKQLGLTVNWTELALLEKEIKTIQLAIQTNKEKIDAVQELQIEQSQLSKSIQSEKEKLALSNNQLTESTATFANHTTEQTKTIAELNSLQQTHKEFAVQLDDQFKALHLSIPEVGLSKDFINQLEKEIQAFNANKKKVDGLLKDIEVNEKDIQTLDQQGKENEALRIKLKAAFEKLEKECLVNREERKALLPLDITVEFKKNALKNDLNSVKKAFEEAVQTLQKVQADAQKMQNEKAIHVNEIEKAKASFDKIKLTLQEKLTASEFDVITQVKAALLSEEDFKRFDILKDQLSAQKVQLETLKEKHNLATAELDKTKTFEITLEAAEKEFATLDEVRETWHTRLGVIHEMFRKDLEIKDRNKEVVTEIETQEKVLKKWSDLMRLLGGAKHAFNTYVQRLTLKNLIQLANVHLGKLNPRYSLRLNDTYKPGEELNFMLVDHYQTNQMRLVDTSSGGEKFLISLSLALGLSDLASHNVSIGSLFIDEGFGTLDNNTLELVISTLETLKSQGKMIGIISHVENLKERIPTQIKVLKKSNGISQIEIV